MAIEVAEIGRNCLAKIKQASWFPYRTGKLKFHATQGRLLTTNNGDVYEIKFDSIIAPYIEALEEGSQPHDIPNAFGKPLPFGIGGRFDGKFHPGSTKHQGFISQRCVGLIVKHICNTYKGELEK